MKKITLFLLTFILLITNVNAEEIIKENKKGEYIRKDIVSDQYKYTDENDIQYGEFSEYYLYDEQVPLDTPYYDYEVKEVTAYYKSYDIDHVQIMASYGSIKYDSLAIYYNDEPIGYQIVEEVDCDNQIMMRDGYIMVKLDKKIPADEKIKISFNVESVETILYFIFMYNEIDLTEPVLKYVANGRTPDVSVNPEWGQYMYDRTKEYYSEEEPTGGKLYFSNGLKKCYRYRDILTYRYNIIPESNSTNDNRVPQETISNNISTTPVTDNVSLVNLDDYQSINVPNTNKMDIWLTLLNILFGITI